jgi:hypothetical protein
VGKGEKQLPIRKLLNRKIRRIYHQNSFCFGAVGSILLRCLEKGRGGCQLHHQND